MHLDHLETIALDEVDEMLDMNFEEELDGILRYVPEARPQGAAEGEDRAPANPFIQSALRLSAPSKGLTLEPAFLF